MHIIKKIIREELEKVLATLKEIDFYKTADIDKPIKKSNPKEEIIYDYEAGRAFGNNALTSDIESLNRYNLVEYLPKSINEESWSFEFETVYGTILIVDIKRTINNGGSVWSIKFGQLYKGEQLPSLIAELSGIPGYANFVNEVNRKISPKMDPAKY